MKKNWLKALGASAIIIILFISVLIFTNQQIPAKSNGENHEKEFEKTIIKEVVKDDNVLMTAFKASEGELEGTSINIWSQIKDGNYSIEEMEEISLKFASLLNLEKNAQIDIIEDDGYNKVIVTNQDKEDIYITIVMENFIKEGLSTESYLLVDLYISKQYEKTTEIKDVILNYFEKQGFDYEYTMTIVGTFSNKMNIDIMKDVVNKTFNSIDGQIIEGMEETEYGEMVSLTGYSPKLQNDIQLAGEQINLNTAMRYSEYDDKTYIWIGTPLIATEY